MSQLPCPEWNNEQEPFDKLDSIVRAAVSIYEFIRRQNEKSYLLNHGNLKDWHGKLFQEVVPVSYYAGNYRSADQRYPCLNIEVQVTGVPGTPFKDVPEKMAKFSNQLELTTGDVDKFVGAQEGGERRLRAAAQLAAFASGSIIQVHPFRNGNGRIARLTADFFFNRYGFRMPFFVNRPRLGVDAEYGTASGAAMLGDFVPLYKYFIVLMAR